MQLNNVMLGVRLNNADSSAVLWERFTHQFNYTGVSLTYSLFKNAYMGIYQIIGSVIIIFSVLALLIALFMVHTSIKKSVYDDYKLIGIYKALGFTPTNIMATYLFQYAILSIVFIPPGLMGASFIIKSLLQSIGQKLGAFEATDSFQQTVFIFSFLVITLMICFTAFFASFKAVKIVPVEAIRTGTPVKRFSKFLFPRSFETSKFPLPILMGMRFLSANTKRFFSQCIIVTLTVFIIIFSINVSFSFENLKYNKPAWGFDNGDIQLRRNESVVISIEHAQLMSLLLQEKLIDKVSPFGQSSLSILSNESWPLSEIYGKVYSDSLSYTGLGNLQGNHPVTANEISVCIGTARQFKKIPGDTISVFIEGQSKNFLITGVYQDVSNMGQGFRLHSNAMKKLNPLYLPSIYSVKLKKGVDPEVYKNYLLKQFGETITIDATIEDRVAQMGTISGMKSALFAVSFFFVLIMLLTIGNDIVICIKENRKHFGVLKSIGWKPHQLRQSMLWRIICLVGIAISLAIPVSILFCPLLIGQITGGVGLIKFPFIINYSSTILAIASVFTLIIVYTWVLTKSSASVNPRRLINT